MKKCLPALLTSLLLVHCTAHAQYHSVFGATVRNPGSVLPEWWNERSFIPEVMHGALHIRLGSAGRANARYGSLGRRNCDIAYLWAAKSDKPLSAPEMEACALLEFHIKKGVDGDVRNINDGFVRKEILAEMSHGIAQRIALFKRAGKFYFRAFGIEIEPYDFAVKETMIRVNWGSHVSPTASYHFRNPRMPSLHNDHMFAVVSSDEAISRALEAARFNTGESSLALSDNVIVFSVDTVDQLAEGARPLRQIHVDLHGLSFTYYDAQGALNKLTVGKP